MKYGTLESADFSFSSFGELGDSGSLLLGMHSPTGRQYIVKHAFPECACNEFMYYVIGTFLGDHLPQTYLIHISEKDHRKCFLPRYLVCSRYLTNTRKVSSMNEIKNNPNMLKQWIVSEAIGAMLSEDDGTEYLVADNAELYRIDTVETFCLSMLLIPLLSLNADAAGLNLGMEMMEKQLKHWRNIKTAYFHEVLSAVNKSVGKDCADVFCEPFRRVLALTDERMKPAYAALKRTYPECLAKYYEAYLHELKAKSKDFLASMPRSGT